MDPRAFRDGVEETEIFCTCEESNHGLSVGRLGHSLKEIAVSPVCVYLIFSTIAGVQGKHKSSSIAVQNFLRRPVGRPNDPFNLHKFHLSVHPSRTLYRQVGIIPTQVIPFRKKVSEN
jgi:hypothetical protein